MLNLKIFNYQIEEFQEKTLSAETNQQSEWIIGRTSTCDLILASPEVSRVHGRIAFEDGQYHYTDLGSTDGSRINHEEAKVNQKYLLKKDDLIRIGDFVLAIQSMEKPKIQEIDGGEYWTEGDLMMRCVRIVQETKDVKTFSFTPIVPCKFSYHPGQFVTLELEIGGQLVQRAYSLSSAPSRPHILEITVKRVPAPSDRPGVPPGLVSNWLHEHLKVGSQVKFCGGAMGKFTCATNPSRKLLMISAGSGITPMMSMTRWLYDHATDSDLVFFHSAPNPEEIIYRRELEMMCSRQPNWRLAVTITRPQLGQPWLGFTGRLNEIMLNSIAPDFRDRSIYVCGADLFMQTVKTMLSQLNFPMENYHQESFGVGKQPKISANAVVKSNLKAKSATITAQPVVCFAQSQQEVFCEEEQSILEVAQQQGIKIRSGCMQGVCGACKKQKREGEVKYKAEADALNPQEKEQGYILPCIAYPVGKVVIEA